MLQSLKEANKVVGTKQVKRAIMHDEAKQLLIAKDAEPRIVHELVALCDERLIEVVYMDTMKELGKACGIEVSAASAAILK
ncbi:ribosomal protein, L7Ae family [Gottschalkia acidurici 9a]|uniref:Ribosomal protein, L7Ae family n=1 Tax=Gottschalkia acidurici (strain ATCC 7906 / DSM 604 / BCRC 14475 / CIP 104303 / KCTC 5404 / NCIMB 10678 / 9a) TaxID=1128398 RepID=K0B2D9_GOTA9|nr:50S ribosomal protein L7ae-like protein [Gottschalkia acidurici]AFS79272.1 ribosomal protein, L7Ae family [Gottschalkia acidurici 9a]